MNDENKSNGLENQPKPQTKNTKKQQKTVIIRRPNDDFKRKYFDYYDDVKISDRQDW